MDSALAGSDAGVPDALNAMRHGVAVKKIRRWRREYQRRGRPRGQAHTAVPCPLCEGGTLDGAAYAELFGWYLGDGYISTQRRNVYGLHLYNDSKYVAINLHLIDEYPADFLRGLFHSDGCLVANWATRMVAGEMKRYEYPRWQLVNESPEIMRWCGESLDRVGVRWRQTKPRVLSVSRRADVARLTELIGEKR